MPFEDSIPQPYVIIHTREFMSISYHISLHACIGLPRELPYFIILLTQLLYSLLVNVKNHVCCKDLNLLMTDPSALPTEPQS